LFITVLVFTGGWNTISETASSVNQGNMMKVFNIDPSEVFVYLLTLSAYQFIRQDLWQRIWAAKNLKTAMNGYWISMVIAILIGTFAVAIGVFSRYGLDLVNIDPVLIYYSVVENVFPFSLAVVMIVVLLAAVISSADSFFIAGLSSKENDIIRPRLKHFDNTRMLFYSKISVLIISVIALVLSLSIPGLVNVMLNDTVMVISSLLAPIIFGLYWKRVTNAAGVASMWGGLITAVIWQILGHPFGLHPVFIGLPISIVILLTVTFLTKPNTDDKIPSEKY